MDISKFYIREHMKNIEKSYLKNTFSFVRTMASNPRTTGAILPSSKYLVREMVSHVRHSRDEYVVELGPGTGVVTAELLKIGIEPKKLIVIEYNENFYFQLKRNFPSVRVVHGDAAGLTNILKDTVGQVGTIISGLPLRSLPRKTSSAILEQIPQVLSPEGKYIQFTYDFLSRNRFYPKGGKLIESQKVMRNLPPAKVNVFSF